MIIHNSNLTGSIVFPAEGHAPLIVDENAEKTLPFAFQDFESVAWGRTQVHEGLRRCYHIQVPQSRRDDIGREAPYLIGWSIMVQVFGSRVAKGQDQISIFYIISFTWLPCKCAL